MKWGGWCCELLNVCVGAKWTFLSSLSAHYVLGTIVAKHCVFLAFTCLRRQRANLSVMDKRPAFSALSLYHTYWNNAVWSRSHCFNILSVVLVLVRMIVYDCIFSNDWLSLCLLSVLSPLPLSLSPPPWCHPSFYELLSSAPKGSVLSPRGSCRCACHAGFIHAWLVPCRPWPEYWGEVGGWVSPACSLVTETVATHTSAGVCFS